MRSDYLPSETFCCWCGFIIKEHHIKGNIEGVITHKSRSVTHVDPLDTYLCGECLDILITNVEGGITRARRRSYELAGLRKDEMGK